MSLTVWTVGHSTRSLTNFLGVLAGYRIELVADTRRFPGSRSQPQYQQRVLESVLQGAGIAYAWLAQLGGRAPFQTVRTPGGVTPRSEATPITSRVRSLPRGC
jgi:uncharacterized protein (DUF488 family)